MYVLIYIDRRMVYKKGFCSIKLTPRIFENISREKIIGYLRR